MADTTTPFGFPYPEDTDLVRDGASDIENLATGVNDYLNGGYLYAGQRRYESSGTFLKADPLGTGDIGLRAIRVRMVGGGGGGGAASGNHNAGSGGGGGGYAEAFITDISGLPGTVTVTRGAGGSSGGTPAGAGGAGGASSFDALVVATGGAAGFGNNATLRGPLPFLGGVGTAGDILAGGNPSIVQAPQRVLETPADPIWYGGHGGSSLLGAGGYGDADAAGGNGRGPGGGGAGGAARVSGGRVGGAGANGIVIVDCFV